MIFGGEGGEQLNQILVKRSINVLATLLLRNTHSLQATMR